MNLARTFFAAAAVAGALALATAAQAAEPIKVESW